MLGGWTHVLYPPKEWSGCLTKPSATPGTPAEACTIGLKGSLENWYCRKPPAKVNGPGCGLVSLEAFCFCKATG